MSTQTPIDIYETYFQHRSQPSTINKAADTLRSFVLASTDPQAVQSNSQWDLVFKDIEEGGLEAHTGLDSLIGNHAKLFQSGSGPTDVGKELSWESYDEEIGHACNLIFTRSELEGKAKKVVERMKEFHGSRLDIILLQAIRGRAHSLNIVRDESTISWIDFSLDPFHDPNPPWSKADFIAVCVLLQGSAKSLLDGLPSMSERQAKLNFWKEKFSAFIYSEIPPDQRCSFNRDGDFIIKWHATLVLDNLISGPFDTSSC